MLIITDRKLKKLVVTHSPALPSDQTKTKDCQYTDFKLIKFKDLSQDREHDDERLISHAQIIITRHYY